MKTAELVSKGKFEICEKILPKIEDDYDVLIKIGSVGVCGSDIHYFKEGKIGDQIVNYPFVLGHECSGKVIDIGQSVKKVKIGDLIAIDPLLSCGNCEQCIQGRSHTCLDQKFMGSPGQLDGGLSEFIVLPEKMCYKLPNNLNQDQGVLVEPLSIGLYTARLIEKVQNKKIAILGFGPIGISVFLCLEQLGCNTIVVTEKLEYRKNIAMKLGALNVFDANKNSMVTEINSNYDHFDVVIECCGEQSAINDAFDILKPGGELLIVGIPETDMIYFNPHLFRRKEIKIQSVRRQNNCVDPMIELLSKKMIDADFMISHNFKINEIDKAFKLVSDYSENVIKAIVNF